MRRPFSEKNEAIVRDSLNYKGGGDDDEAYDDEQCNTTLSATWSEVRTTLNGFEFGSSSLFLPVKARLIPYDGLRQPIARTE